MDNGFLPLLGLAKRARRVAAGETAVYDAVADHKAKAVFVASDAAENSTRKLQNRMAASKACLIATPFTKDALGDALGLTGCAMVALLDAGFAYELAEKILPAEHETLGALKEKSEREKARRKEAAKHLRREKQRKNKNDGGVTQ